MTKEFNLSENIVSGYMDSCIETGKVKEFIKRLKEELMQEGIYGDRDYTIMTIDKLGGDKLKWMN